MTFSSTAEHAGHFGLVYFHVSGGTVMRFVGLANLYIGITRKYFKYHRLVGGIYLVGGALGADAIATAEQKIADLKAQIEANGDLSMSLAFD